MEYYNHTTGNIDDLARFGFNEVDSSTVELGQICILKCSNSIS